MLCLRIFFVLFIEKPIYHCILPLIDVHASMAYFGCRKVIYIDDNPPLGEHILSLSSNVAHEDEIAFFQAQGITTSAFRPEIL